ncbi:MAG TPA: NAD(P)-dependent oxidoreductase [Flavobacteriales bacterium]|nr:NAD(P)-dependent oxidoreductase [Flavobacteriales bacterium]
MNVAFIDTVHPILNQMLEAKGITCHDLHQHDIQSLKLVIKDFDGIVIRSRFPMNPDFLQHATKLKFIARSGSGLENIDLEYCQKNNIVCFNSPEGNRDAVGEHAIGMLLMLFDKLKKADQEVRKGIWLREENRGLEIAGKTIGIIGCGVMGNAFAKRLSGFDCTVIGYDKYKKNYTNQFIHEVSLEELQQRADVISLHVPLTSETKYMLDLNFISKTGKQFYLINTSRGPCVNTADLVEALKSGKIKGACLDVLEYEKSSFENLDMASLPEPMHYLAASDKVILSPHIAGWTFESYYKLSSYLGEKIIQHFGL